VCAQSSTNRLVDSLLSVAYDAKWPLTVDDWVADWVCNLVSETKKQNV